VTVLPITVPQGVGGEFQKRTQPLACLSILAAAPLGSANEETIVIKGSDTMLILNRELTAEYNKKSLVHQPVAALSGRRVDRMRKKCFCKFPEAEGVYHVPRRADLSHISGLSAVGP
jgi:hypothetical protein